VKNGAHLPADLFIKLAKEFLLLGILAGHKMGSDEIVDIGEERIAGFGAALGGRFIRFVGNLIEDAAGDDGTGGLGLGAGFGDDAAEDIVGDFLEGLGIFEAAAHGAERGKEIATFKQAINVEVIEFRKCEAEFGAVVASEAEAQLDAELRREMFNHIAIDGDGPAAKDRLNHATTGAAGKITHNEYLERCIRFRCGGDPALTRCDIHYHVRISSFWHLFFPLAVGNSLPLPYFTREPIQLGNNNEFN